MTLPDQAPALWRLLQQTAAATEAVLKGQSLTAFLDSVPTALKPATQSLSFLVMRHLGLARALSTLLAPKKPAPAVHALLCTALALCHDESTAPYTPFTLVNQTVEAARKQARTRAQAGFLNACLRRFLRERVALLARLSDEPQAQWNHPHWWIERLKQEHPMHWQGLLQRAQAPAPMTLRVNLGRGSVQEYQARLMAAGLGTSWPVGASGLQLSQAVPVQRLPGFDVGDVSVQDAAAQLAAPLLLRGRESSAIRILDACAAPGGKTGHLLELRPDAQVLALDVDAKRCERIRQNLRRLGQRAEVRQADAACPEQWWDGQLFDAILLDAPCTASGIVRRHPDIRWLRRPDDSAQLARIQNDLLQRLWPLLAPGGRLLYCTCSVFRTEGDGVVQSFLQRNSQALLLPSPGHLLASDTPQTLGVADNPLGEHDGFYYALLEKQASGR